MIISKSELCKVKNPENFIYKVYLICSKRYYNGTAKVSAINIEQANKIINEFKNSDKNNDYDSGGFEYVNKYDDAQMLSDKEGIFDNYISYSG